ncbi:MAG: Gldg family protein [Anaerolineae bacterium]|nr:Gldg family protein [Anaerolineae bacterium]
MRESWKQSLAIARKELGAYFGSPMALIFVGAFLVVTLFSFFWTETFFARNIADVRPLFRWMPVLMIFLVAALTMRQWSEEQRGGTLEVLLTLPVRRGSLVWGKFMAVVALIALALALTLFLPLTVTMLGPLDWGPVLGGYLAAILMASAYAAIGLFVSSRTDNQIVALILTVVICGAFYLVGSTGVTDFAGDALGEVLRAIGTGSRFESIERGVIDLRDLIYYLSLTAFFLVANVVSLDAKRWSRGPRTAAHRRSAILSVVLVAANLLALNTWLFPVHGLRADLTAQGEYSLSQTTRDLIRNPSTSSGHRLQEPLLMRGYFSKKTHPLLAPLVPTIRDMMREYEIASGGKINAEIIDPRENEELEAEANRVYGIRPTPFRIAGRYESSVVSSYFDILIRYGDQSATLGFQDLIEVQSAGGGEFEVGLRNLEYDLTRSIKKVVCGFQSLDAVFASMEEPIKLTTFVTPQTLPEPLAEVPQLIEKVAQDIQAESGGKFTFEMIDPDDPNSPLTRQSLFDSYDLRPIAVSLFSPESYYLHTILQIGDEGQLFYPSGDMSEADLRAEIEAVLKRAAPGFLKTVGLWHPSEEPIPSPYGGTVQPISSWQLVWQQLRQSYTLKLVDLSSGRVPGDVDVLVVIAPQGLGDAERFAIDQYLMRGGAVVVAAGNYILSPQQFGGALLIEAVQDGLQEMLAHYGIEVGNALVMDPQNEPFPVPVQRSVAGMTVVEYQQLPHPFFVDVRRDGMATESPIVADLPAVTLNWVSPVEVDEEKNKDREVVTLLQSTAGSWLRSSANVQPDLQTYPKFGFPVEGEQQVRPLAVSIRGSFESYFKDKLSPLQEGEAEASALGTIEVSPESSRLVVVGSAEFVDDVVLEISRRFSQDRYLLNLQLLQNIVDWAVEDEDLLSIRSRGTYARLLRPMEKDEHSFWEGLNYALALLAVIGIGVVWNIRQRSEEPMPLVDVEIN